MLTLKKKVNKNYKGQVPLSKQKKVMTEGPIALEASPPLDISNIESPLKFISEMMLLHHKQKCFC
jgi:hypothetical protein